jgi:hypothetical protein
MKDYDPCLYLDEKPDYWDGDYPTIVLCIKEGDTRKLQYLSDLNELLIKWRER